MHWDRSLLRWANSGPILNNRCVYSTELLHHFCLKPSNFMLILCKIKHNYLNLIPNIINQRFMWSQTYTRYLTFLHQVHELINKVSLMWCHLTAFSSALHIFYHKMDHNPPRSLQSVLALVFPSISYKRHPKRQRTTNHRLRHRALQQRGQISCNQICY